MTDKEELEIIRNQRAFYAQTNPQLYDFLIYENSCDYYNPIIFDKFKHLTPVQYIYYKEVFDTLCYQNGYIYKLAKEGDWSIGCQLVRLQIELLTIIYADIKFNNSIILKVFQKDTDLGKIKIKGSCIKPSDLRKEIDIKYNTNIDELYRCRYSKFTHPSSYLFAFGIPEGIIYVDDALLINQTLIKVLNDYNNKSQSSN